MFRIIVGALCLVLPLIAIAKDQRIYQRDKYGNIEYNKPEYQTDKYGNLQHKKSSFSVK